MEFSVLRKEDELMIFIYRYAKFVIIGSEVSSKLLSSDPFRFQTEYLVLRLPSLPRARWD